MTPDWKHPTILSARGSALRANWPLDKIAGHCHGLAYLATPYTRHVRGVDGNFCATRSAEMAQKAAAVSATLARDYRVTAVSPIVAAHAMIGFGRIDPLDDGFWINWCRPLLSASAVVIVPDIAGWRDSRGTYGEVIWALTHGCPVFVEGAL